jgi:hypothetical protein
MPVFGIISRPSVHVNMYVVHGFYKVLCTLGTLLHTTFWTLPKCTFALNNANNINNNNRTMNVHTYGLHLDTPSSFLASGNAQQLFGMAKYVKNQTNGINIHLPFSYPNHPLFHINLIFFIQTHTLVITFTHVAQTVRKLS